MMIDREARKLLFETVAHRIIASADELTDLDRAIGDGDHGANMRRGFEAVLAAVDELSAKNLGESLKGVGTTLGDEGRRRIRSALRHPVHVARQDAGGRGDARAGRRRLRGCDRGGQGARKIRCRPEDHARRAVSRRSASCAKAATGLPVRLKATAREAAEKTIPMRAIRGRASFLGERSIGHMDPGARSSELIVDAVADVMEGIA